MTAARLGRAVPSCWDWDGWATGLEHTLLTANADFEPDWERAALAEATTAGRALLSVRISAGEVLIGPLWTPDGTGSCAGCAHAWTVYRQWEPEQRFVRDRVAREDAGPWSAATSTSTAAAFPPWLGDVVGSVVTAPVPLAPGELVAVSRTGTVTRHRVVRTFRCRLCGDPAPAPLDPDGPPVPLVLHRQPTTDPVPTRGRAPFDLDPDRMRAAMADARFGPVTRMTRHSAGAFPISEVELLVGTPAGLGRAATFGESEAIGVLEALERTAGYPHAAPILTGVAYDRLGDRALDPARLGRHTAAQLAVPRCRLRPYTAETPMDWVWGRPIGGGDPLLVPAEIGYFRYRYDLRESERRNVFLESSSGSALGGTFEEAALHSLLELAERDAFLLAWHRGRPLPRINPASVTDPQSRMLLRLARDRGYDVHLLVATADIPVPVVWALAVRPDRALPASFSTAGCHVDPVRAVRSALWELTQLVVSGLNWDPAEVEPTIDDPWLVETISQHWRRYTFPELLPRVERVLGGLEVTLDEAFPGWPGTLMAHAGGDVTGALEHLVELYRRAGLDTVLVVDQSTPDHAALGTSVVKCVVPGIVPMCFGQAYQRLDGLDRLLTGLDADPADLPFDPHPFP